MSIRTLAALSAALAIAALAPAQGAATIADRIDLTTEDGVNIAALHARPANAEDPRPAVVLLHGGNQNKELWWEVGVPQALADDDYHILAIDIRGRGESEVGDLDALKANPTLAHRDLDAALAWLRQRDDVDHSRIALMGASYGANLICSWMMTRDEPITTIVCLSATAAAHRFLTLFEEHHDIKTSGLYLACDNELERYKADETAVRLGEETEGRAVVEVYEGKLHALGIPAYIDGANDLIRQWLQEELRDAPG